MPYSSVGRRSNHAEGTPSSRFRRVFDYWNAMDSANEDSESEDEPERGPIREPDRTPTRVPDRPPIREPTGVPTTKPDTVPETKPEVKPTTVPDKEPDVIQDVSVLKVVKLNLNTLTNAVDHRTSEFDAAEKKLVIRRGQTFNVDIEFNRPYDKAVDDLRIVLEFGSSPINSNQSHVEFILSAEDTKNEWGGFIKSQTGNVIQVCLVSPPDCYVGKWMFKIDVVKVGDEDISVYRYNHRSPIYILFNPWCKDDAVYMHDTPLLGEYILNENGVIFVGSYRRMSFKVWSFGQFEKPVLDCCMYLLDKMSGMPDHVRGNPIAVVRKLSALINIQDDRGILVGNWSGEYEGGTPPLEWTGSLAILEEFYSTKKPVKFAQCWVYSAVFTTLCRALGIPIRSLSNFESAHDTDGTITIDYHFDVDGEPMKDYDSDSVWNFHVWNDVWMSRPDLPAGYGGWQAVDATPQEASGGIYCMGPMSLKAIKLGQVFYNYDGPFVFAEVNADIVNWKMEKDGQYTRIALKKERVGRCIKTKAALSYKIEDLTMEYKFEEGSKEERAALFVANMLSSKPDIYSEKSGFQDVDFEVDVGGDVFIGDNVEVVVKVTNNSTEERKLSGTVVIYSMFYTGVHFKDILKEKITDKVVRAGATERIRMKIGEYQYLDLLRDHCILGISGLIIVHPTSQCTPITADIRLKKPHLSVTAPDKGKKGEVIPVEVTFQNPLSVPLTDCNLRVEGAGLQKPLVLKFGDVKSKENFVGKFDLRPKKSGQREVSMAFNSKQLRSVNSSHSILVL